MAFEKETEMENRLIDALIQGKSQWTRRDDLNTQDKLWANVREKLNANNRGRLGGRDLTDGEFEQVANKLNFNSFYDAGRFLAGENGKVRIAVQRDSGETVSLVLFDRDAVAGGTTSYEVIHQCRAFQGDNTAEGNRRFDLTLLFNGLPLIHVELKNGMAASYTEAFNQIQKYINEGRFNGLFSLVQMFVISNGADTRYFAAAQALNKEFLTTWTNDDRTKTPVNDLFRFAEAVLSIPMAHRMVTDYLILDQKKKSIVLLRPYQIHAIEAIQRASQRHESGYVWHTTGSGKTLTSYKAARNLLLGLRNVDKTVFLIDRKDLDDKTTDDFKAYAENDTIVVDETDNTGELRRKLLADDRTMVVTTVQKLRRLVREYSGPKATASEATGKRLRDKKVVFVVDECHRAVTKQAKAEFDAFFRHPLWYGFTGTPIFDQNQGSLGATTEQLYGKCLHRYTLADALRDKAVLPINSEFFGGEGEADDPAFYAKREHRIEVAKTILSRCLGKLGIGNPAGKAYDAILSTGSIPLAQAYYDLFKEIKAGKVPGVAVPKEIRDRHPDWPKVAITYSLQENKDDSERNGSLLSADIDDYNAMFGTGFGKDAQGIEAYNRDLANRLARKGPEYERRDRQLDLAIVADRLLTGFDAPCLSAVFLDRPPMSPHGLIQALSRTNRLFDAEKIRGFAVSFQSADKWKESTNKAIQLFTDGGSSSLMATWESADKELKSAADALLALTPHPADVDALEPRKKRTFVNCFKRLDAAKKNAEGFTEWYASDKSISDYGIAEADFQAFAGKYRDVLAELRREADTDPDAFADEGQGEECDLNYDLVSDGTMDITLQHIIDVMRQDGAGITKEQALAEIAKLAQRNPPLGEVVRKFFEEATSGGQSLASLSPWEIRRKLQEAQDKAKERYIDAFCEKYSVRKGDVVYLVGGHPERIDDNSNLDLQPLFANADFGRYRAQHPEARLFSYHVAIREGLKSLINDSLVPLQDD